MFTLNLHVSRRAGELRLDQVPKGAWPDASFAQRRIVPWSYAMNVCTHSYSLVWYGWEEWSAFIDWMALSGINNFLAETGQEEIAWKVLTEMGLNDTTIRNWFNGPALLTWSRGQNEYGGTQSPTFQQYICTYIFVLLPSITTSLRLSLDLLPLMVSSASHT